MTGNASRGGSRSAWPSASPPPGRRRPARASTVRAASLRRPRPAHGDDRARGDSRAPSRHAIEFPVESVGLIQGAHPGDRIRFKLRAGDESHGLLTVVALASDAPAPAGWLDRLMLGIAVALGLLACAGAVGLAIVLRRELQTLHRRLIALDHEAGTLRGLITDTQDGMRQIARALEEAATTLRVGYVREVQRRLVSRPSPATDASSAAGAAEPAAALVVVQRGRGELYHAVEGGAAGPGLAVMWDRRRTDRRRNGAAQSVTSAARPSGEARPRDLDAARVPGHPRELRRHRAHRARAPARRRGARHAALIRPPSVAPRARVSGRGAPGRASPPAPW